MEAQNENDELYPIAVLIDELKVQIHPLPAYVWRDLKLTTSLL